MRSTACRLLSSAGSNANFGVGGRRSLGTGKKCVLHPSTFSSILSDFSVLLRAMGRVRDHVLCPPHPGRGGPPAPVSLHFRVWLLCSGLCCSSQTWRSATNYSATCSSPVPSSFSRRLPFRNTNHFHSSRLYTTALPKKFIRARRREVPPCHFSADFFFFSAIILLRRRLWSCMVHALYGDGVMVRLSARFIPLFRVHGLEPHSSLHIWG
ncbi:hypothetical protein C8R47DRAFT_306348 [Mycena vitilis]|nr:hypothetical protein C8R47DRAFT_306348 [Mycena vitilis]